MKTDLFHAELGGRKADVVTDYRLGKWKWKKNRKDQAYFIFLKEKENSLFFFPFSLQHKVPF